MKRWALVRDGMVREYLLGDAPLIAEFNRRAWGDEASIREDGSRVEDEGEWIAVPNGAGLVTTGWRYANGVFSAPK